MELEESTCLTSDYTTKPQSSRQYGTGTKIRLLNWMLSQVSSHWNDQQKLTVAHFFFPCKLYLDFHNFFTFFPPNSTAGSFSVSLAGPLPSPSVQSPQNSDFGPLIYLHSLPGLSHLASWHYRSPVWWWLPNFTSNLNIPPELQATAHLDAY